VSAQRVVVVGGGVAGLSAAYSLRRRGAEVTVLESNRLGSGASAGNAGWLCPAQAGPLPEPGLAADGVRSLLQRDSALYFAPASVPRMLGWLAGFASHCNARDHRHGTEALARLGRRAFELIDRWIDDGVDVPLQRTGLLVCARERDGAQRFLDALQPMRALGHTLPERVLEAGELHEQEPILADVVRAGLLIEEHRHVHPPTLMAALSQRLAAMGVTLEQGAEVLGLEVDGGRVRALRSTAGSLDCDAVVLAAGAWTPRLTRELGVRLPVAPGKGYSFEVRGGPMPRRALLLLEPHVACSPLGDRLRVAGTMEFSGVNARLDQRRVATMVRGVGGMVRDFAPPELEQVWTGMRPIAPDGLPIIDRCPRHENLYLATAYSMLGMTIAAPAGDALAELIMTGRRPPELEPFRAARFPRLWQTGARRIARRPVGGAMG
jgi:D-amino-acid dehydrogenase